MNREVNLTKLIQTRKGPRYCPVAWAANGRIRADMNNGSGFFCGWEAQRCSTSRLRRRAPAKRGHHPCPPPHAATEKKQEPRASLGRQHMTECGIAENFVLRHDAR